MRIAMLHVDLPPGAGGGVASQVSRLADVLGKRGHDVTVHTLSATPPGTGYSVEQMTLPTLVEGSRLGRLIAVPLLFATRRYVGCDVVHAHGDSQLLLRRHIPIVRTFYGSAKEEAKHAKRLSRRVSQYSLVPAERVARRLATVTVGISRNTCCSIGPLDAVIPCGVDRRAFSPGPKSGRPSVLFVGTVDGRKRGRVLLEAFAEHVLPRVPDAELWVVSADRTEGLGVRWFGRVNDSELALLFSSAWVFCLPSSYEGFGVPYVEALASGTAVVASRNAGSEEILVPDSGGVVVADETIGEAVASVLVDTSWRRSLEVRGRVYSERFDWERVSQDYEAAYALAIARRANRWDESTEQRNGAH